MKESTKKKEANKEIREIKTFPVPFTLDDIKKNLTITQNTPSNPSKEQIIVASSGWVTMELNFLPGLGAGYHYQRRWIPYFLTVGVVTAWFVIGAVLNEGQDATKTGELIGVGGGLLISITTMIEAKIAQKKAMVKIEEKLQAKPKKKKGGLFR